MSPKQRYFRHIQPGRQKGFLIPLAIFILVVMGMFALVLSRNTIQTNALPTLEMMTLQAFYAAESGGYRGMRTLFFSTGGVPLTREAVDTRCVALNATHNFTVAGLKTCSAVVTCTCTFTDQSNCSPITPANYINPIPAGKLNSFYKISSVATCGSGNYRAVRTVEAGAMLQ